MAFADTAVRTLLEAINPGKVVLAAACEDGDLLGYSAGWKLADGNAGIVAEMIAMEQGIIGQEISACPAAVITGFIDGTAGAAVYLSDTAGSYAASASATSGQQVGEMLDATTATINLGPGGVGVPSLAVSIAFAAADVASIFYTASNRVRVTKISEVHATVAGQAGTLTVERLQGTEAPAAGDDLLGTTKIDLAGTINTVQSPALTGTAAHLILEVGNRLALKVASGAATSLANANVTVDLVPA